MLKCTCMLSSHWMVVFIFKRIGDFVFDTSPFDHAAMQCCLKVLMFGPVLDIREHVLVLVSRELYIFETLCLSFCLVLGIPLSLSLCFKILVIVPVSLSDD